MKIRSYLLAFGVALILPAMVFAVVALAGFARQQRSAVEQQSVETARALMSAVDRELARSITALQALGTARSLERDDLATFYEDARRVMKAQRDWLTITLISPTGERLLDLSLPFGALLPPLSERGSFEAILRSGEPAIGPTARGRIVRRLGIPVRVPVMRGDRLVYVLTAVLELEGIDGILRRQQLPADWIGVVFDSNRTIVARTRGEEQFVGHTVSPGLSGLLDTVPEGWGGVRNTLDGTPVYAAFSRSAWTGWGVAIGIPAAAVDGPLRRSLWILAGGGVMLLAASAVASIRVGRSIARPVTALAAAARALDRSEGTLLPSRTSGPQEVVEVAMTLMELAAERRQIEKERAEAVIAESARAEAEAASRAKDEFLAMLGHELRSPLHVLSTSVAILDKLGTPDEPSARTRAIIARQVAHLTDLVEDLLDVARTVSGKIRLVRRPCDLGEVVSRTLDTMDAAGRLERHVMRQDVTTVWVNADETRLEQILINLVSNAVKFTPDEGEITVTVRRDGDHAVLRVADTGVGIDPELLPRIFDTFVQAERSLHHTRDGLGLGLALVRRLAELHDGMATAASAGRARGAAFTVRLPCIPASAADDRLGPSPASALAIPPCGT